MQLKKLGASVDYYVGRPMAILTSHWRSTRVHARTQAIVEPDLLETNSGVRSGDRGKILRIDSWNRWFDWRRFGQPKTYTGEQISKKFSRRRRWRLVQVWFWPSFYVFLAISVTGIFLVDTKLPKRLMGAAISSGTQSLANHGMRVDAIEVSGNRFVSKAEILAASGLVTTTPILNLDANEVRRRLMTLPWVAEAVVEVKSLSTVKIAIVEREPVALWRESAEFHSTDPFYLVDATGKAFAREGSADSLTWSVQNQTVAIPRIVGVGGNRLADVLRRFLQSQPSLSNRISWAEWVEERRWNIVLDNRLLVKLPEGDADRAWSILAGLESRYEILEREIAVVDLRQEDRLVLTGRRGVAATGGWLSSDGAKQTTWGGVSL
ncbi:MAG: FtsQ-type POTRA domain-containing protein [Alphaproteobacteria bacterium]|nr:FtsQ-type POTRA domain-containing protein [Alphaproteobacteria bacterium]